MPDVIVDLDEYATPEEVAEVDEVMRDAGLDAEVRVFRPREERAPEEQIGNGIFWQVVIVTGALLWPFVEGFGQKAGADGWDWLKSVIGKARRARRNAHAPDGWVEVGDSEGTRLMIGEPVKEAFDKLREIGPEAVRGKHLRWDDQRREWVPY